MAHEMFLTIIFGFHYYENEPLWFRNVGNAKKKNKSTLPRNPVVSHRVTGKIRLICDGK